MADWITTGTITATNGSTAITGSGTTFTTDGIRANDIIWIPDADGPHPYPIASVESATGLTLQINYEGTTGGSKPYVAMRRFDEEKAADVFRLVNTYIQSLEEAASVGQAGIRYLYESSTSMASPTSGYFRMNNASPASVTAIAISDLSGETGNPDSSAWINSWDDSSGSVKGYVYIKKAGDPSTFMIYRISALTDNSGWSQLSVTYVAGNGAIVSNDAARIEFYRSGDDGFDAGLRHQYDSSTTDSDPGAGKFRFNNSTFASISFIYVDNVDLAGATITSWLDALDDSTSLSDRGFLRFQKTNNPNTYRDFRITGAVIDGTGYRKIPVSPIITNGTWTNNDTFISDFARAGNAGADGYQAGHRLTFSTTTTDSDPGAGVLRLNNASASLATFAYIDNAAGGGGDITAWLDSLDDSTDGNVKGYLRIQKADDPTIYREFAVTGAVVNGTGYRKVPIDLIAENGALGDGASVVLTFFRTGNAGSNGYEAGFFYNFSTTTTDSDPGSGNLRFNNALFGSIAFIYIDDEDAAANDITAWVATLDDSDSVIKGNLHIQKKGDPTVYRHFQINNTLTDATGYTKIPVAPVAAAGSLADGDDIVLTFSRTGDSGDGNGDFLSDGSVAMTGDIDFNGNGTIDLTDINGGQIAGFRNHIINGSMMVAQRGTSFTSTGGANNDDAYTLDRWILLVDGNDTVDVTQSTEAPTNGLNSIALDVETINRKFGILQVIEQKNCIGLIGNRVTLSFKAKASSIAKLDNLKAAIVSWSGTADAVTSDIVSAWGAEDTNPTLAANWTYENTPTNLGPTTSWATYSVSADIDTASTKNIGVFIWSDVTDTTLGEFLYITDVQLEVGNIATQFERRPYGVALAMCQRYYYRTPDMAVGARYGSGFVATTSTANFYTPFPVAMRAAPSSVEQSGTASDYTVSVAGTNVACTSVPSYLFATSTYGITIFTTAATMTAGHGCLPRAAQIAGYLAWSAEL